MKRLATIVWGTVMIVGAMSLYRLYQDSSPTPRNAVTDYITRITSESPQKIESLISFPRPNPASEVTSSSYSFKPMIVAYKPILLDMPSSRKVSLAGMLITSR